MPGQSRERLCVLLFVAFSGPNRSQGKILAVWMLSAKLPKSDANFAVDFRVDFSSCPLGQKRQLDVAGQKLPRDTFCVSIVSRGRG